MTAVGGRADLPEAGRTIDLAGGTLVPAFCDGHVHLPATGLYSLGADLRGKRSVAEITATLADRADRADAVLFGGNFEDPPDAGLDRTAIDRVVGDRPAMLARADMHSCVVSTALLDTLDIDGLEGVDRDGDARPTGYLRERAASKAWQKLEQSLSRAQLTDAIHSALRLAAAKGIAAVHEMLVVEWRGWSALEWYLEAIADPTIDVVTYVGTDEVSRVKELGFTRIGGDYFLDGSFGSHTAWMRDGYESAPPPGTPPTGIRYRDDDDLFDFFMAAQDADLQVGVHAIGDAAIEQAVVSWEQVADKVGVDAVRARAHRIEHFECAGDDHIDRASRLGLGASVQPAFDLFWGGEDALYARRIGWERARLMNRFKTMLRSGITLGAGSDSTVTPLDPFLQMKALRSHHLPEERLDALSALEVHTTGSFSLAGEDRDRGVIRAGASADLAWLDRDPIESSPEELTSIEVLGTWCRGRRAWPEGDA